MSLASRIRSWFTKPPEPQGPVEPSRRHGLGAYIQHPGTVQFDGRSGGAKYPYGLSTHAPGLIVDHYATRQQARDAYHDTPQAKALVDRYADTVADIGLRLESDPKYDLLGIDPERAEAIARQIEESFDSWAQSKQSHRAQTMNLYQAQRLYAIMQQRDNDQFVRLFYDRKDLISPLQFEFYDANQIMGHGYTNTLGPNYTPDGIIRNPDGTEKAYRVWYAKPDGKYQSVEIPHLGNNSGLPHMLHGFYAEHPGQTRGYSRLAHALQEFEKLTDFSVATVNRAIKDAMFTMAVENQQLDPSDPLEDLARTPGGAGPAAQMFGAQATSSDLDGELSEFTGQPNYTAIPEAAFSGSSVGIFNLKRGDTIKSLGNQASAQAYNQFVDAFTGHLAASMSMPLEVLLMKFGSNYSASRATLILFWRIAEIWKTEMAADFLNPVFEAFLTLEIAAGRLSLPGWSDPRLRQAWLNCRWIGAPMPNIDPAKTANADRAYIEMGATTLDRVARNLNGSSAASNRNKLRREYDDLPAPPWQDWNQVDDPESEQEGGTVTETDDQDDQEDDDDAQE